MAVTKKPVTLADAAVTAAPAKAEAAPKKTAAPKEAAPKEAAAEKKTAAVEKKAAEKKAPAAKKAPAKKAAAPKAAKVFVEFAGRQVAADEVVEKAKAAYAAAGNKAAVKSLEVYIKPEENVAYYVVNGVGADDWKVTLD